MDDVIGSVEPALRAAVLGFLDEHRLPGASVGVVRDGELAWSFGAGFADRTTGRVPDVQTLYRIASITKTFTTTAILQLRDDGRLRLDDPLSRHLPEFAAATNPFGPIEDVTIRRLLMHTSGLQGEPPNHDLREATTYRPDELAEVLGEIRVVIPPDSATKYSNLGFELLGLVVSRVSGTPFQAYVRRRITRPLGMAATTFHPAARRRAALATRMAVGYDARTFDDDLSPAKVQDSDRFEADGGLWSSVEDLARWIGAQRHTGDDDRRGRSGRILDGATLHEAHRPWIHTTTDDPWTEAQGLGWYTERRDGTDWTGHAGSIEGFSSKITWSPRDGVGVIVLLNGIGSASDLAARLASIALPPCREATAAARALVRPPATPEAWRGLLGTYVMAGYGDALQVEVRDGHLVIVDPEDPTRAHRLTATEDPLRFRIVGGRPGGEAAIFLRGATGAVDAVNLGGYPMTRLVPATTASPGETTTASAPPTPNTD